MTLETVQRISLRDGNLAHTASSAYTRTDGSLVFELHDWRPETEGALGRECAWMLVVASADKDQLLLRLIQERFADYDEAKAWVIGAGVPCTSEFDGWA